MSTEDTGAPNLDAMPRDELLEFARTAHNGPTKAARALFPNRPQRYVRATRDLAMYADLKATAMNMRVNGNITGATHYESLCERIYKRLPDFARW